MDALAMAVGYTVMGCCGAVVFALIVGEAMPSAARSATVRAPTIGWGSIRGSWSPVLACPPCTCASSA